MKKEIISQLHSSFELAVNETDGVEYWLARDLQKLGLSLLKIIFSMNYLLKLFAKIKSTFILKPKKASGITSSPQEPFELTGYKNELAIDIEVPTILSPNQDSGLFRIDF